MQLLTIDPIIPFVVRPGPMTVALCGCGGTGSHIAQALARIARHWRDGGGAPLRLLFIDGDTVEEKNVGRQLFAPADVGKNKAQILAARFSALFGLAIDAVAEMATVDRLASLGGLTRRYGGKNDSVGILVGAVDNAVARKSLHGALHQQKCWHLWLDCGNHEEAGQVAVGTETDAAKLHDAIKVGICAKLPAPSLIYPGLLAATERQRRADCAAAMEDNLQGLMVNMQVAAIAAAYLDGLIVRRRISSFTTVFDQTTLAMRSTPITERAIRAIYEQRATSRQQEAA